MIEEGDLLLAEAEIGESARQFLDSELGKCLLGMAQQDAEDAKSKLATVDPEDKVGIVKLQRDIAHCNRFASYLAELVSRGDEAIEVIREKREAAR